MLSLFLKAKLYLRLPTFTGYKKAQKQKFLRKTVHGSNRSNDREIELIKKEIWKKRKEKMFKRRNWMIHNVKVI